MKQRTAANEAGEQHCLRSFVRLFPTLSIIKIGILRELLPASANPPAPSSASWEAEGWLAGEASAPCESFFVKYQFYSLFMEHLSPSFYKWQGLASPSWPSQPSASG